MSNNLNETKQSELLNIQTSVEKNGNKENLNSELIHKEKIEGTPFTIVGTEEKGYFLTMGKYKLTENMETIGMVRQSLEKNKWDIIIRMVTSTHEMVVNSMLEEQEAETETNEEFEERLKQKIKEMAENEIKQNKYGE